MQASETKLRQLLEGTKQYVVPLFQRPYSWSEKQWRTLWADVVEQARHEDARPHFFGSIVTMPARSVPQGVGKYLLIDGQQRITTVQVFLSAIRDAAEGAGDRKLRERIDGQYLSNVHEEGDEQLKVMPTQDDRGPFRATVRGEGEPTGRIGECYRFFRQRLDRVGPEEFDPIHSAIVDRLSVVSITCDEHDNPHLIFESLNAKGEKLTPADLIRNYVLMKVHVGDQDRLFRQRWLPIQQALGSQLTEFVRHYLMKEGKILGEADVYFELKERLANARPADAEAFLDDLHRHGLHYSRFVEPARESDLQIAGPLDRLRRLKVTVAYPLLLRVFDSAERGELTRGQLVEVLGLLESFVIRRSICNLPTNQLRRMLPPVFDAAGGAGPGLLDGLREQLGGKRCPGDAEFASALATRPIYSTADKNIRLRLILERLERSFEHKEPADLASATIEHVMPQTLTNDWREELGPDAEDTWAELLHSLGNLTLSGYNSQLSNSPYQVKRDLLAGSHFVLNLCFAEIDRWSAESIKERGRQLAQRALAIWPDVGGRNAAAGQPRRVAPAPAAVRFRGENIRVRSWREAFLKLVERFEATQPGLLQEMARTGRNDAIVSSEESKFSRSRYRLGSVFINTHGSAAALQDLCRRIAQEAGIDPSDYDFVKTAGVSEAE